MTHELGLLLLDLHLGPPRHLSHVIVTRMDCVCDGMMCCTGGELLLMTHYNVMTRR